MENGDQVYKRGCYVSPRLKGEVIIPQDSRGGVGVNNPNEPPYIRHWL